MKAAIAARIVLGALLLGVLVVVVTRVRSRELPEWQPSVDTPLRGAFHVHSDLSHDSGLGLTEIAAVARDLGLSFVVITDHNQGLAGPVEIEGVTLLSAAELSTPFGHVIQLGGSEPLPEAQRGALDILDRLRAKGAWPVIAHPADPKRPWEGSTAGAGGLEIANYASSSRRRGGPVWLGLVPALLASPLRRELALVQAYDRDTRALAGWDAAADPSVVGLCAADAHGRIDLADNLRVWQIVLESPLPREGERAAAIGAQLRAGQFHCVAPISGSVPRFAFYARGVDGARIGQGQSVAMGALEELVVEGPVGLRGASLMLLRNGEVVVRTREASLTYSHPSPGTYRVELVVSVPEVVLGERLVPLIYSNRIRVQDDPRAAPP